jgi:hypothetical protein
MNPSKQGLLNEEIRTLMGKDDEKFWQEADNLRQVIFFGNKAALVNFWAQRRTYLLFTHIESLLVAGVGLKLTDQNEPSHLTEEVQKH